MSAFVAPQWLRPQGLMRLSLACFGSAFLDRFEENIFSIRACDEERIERVAPDRRRGADGAPREVRIEALARRETIA